VLWGLGRRFEQEQRDVTEREGGERYFLLRGTKEWGERICGKSIAKGWKGKGFWAKEERRSRGRGRGRLNYPTA